MRIGVPCEPADQPRAAASPQTVERMIRLGYEVLVEHGAGARAQFPDEAYEAAGARLAGGAQVWGCDVVVSSSAPAEEHLALMSRGAVLICRLDPARRPELLESLRERGITALALDVVPRISRAQSLDVLSSQANLAGYRAVIEAAAHLGRLFSGQVTAAGKFPPATVYVIGAGVAGLSAIGTACSLGAQVRGSDVRPEVADQVRSMGAQFVPLPSAQEVSSDGYAKEMSADQASAANALYAQQAAESDVVITTASIPGRRAPMLLDRSAIEAMRPGSVIIDMAAATGGNTELTVPGQVVTTGGVTIVGHTDLAGMLPAQATQLYGRNIVNLLGLLGGDDAHRAGAGCAPGAGHRRRRHAGGRLDHELLLGMGLSLHRFHGGQRPAHHHRGTGGILGGLLVLPHVPGHEPLLRLSAAGRLRDRLHQRRLQRFRAGGHGA